jgi:hypothetical protein
MRQSRCLRSSRDCFDHDRLRQPPGDGQARVADLADKIGLPGDQPDLLVLAEPQLPQPAGNLRRGGKLSDAHYRPRFDAAQGTNQGPGTATLKHLEFRHHFLFHCHELRAIETRLQEGFTARQDRSLATRKVRTEAGGVNACAFHASRQLREALGAQTPEGRPVYRSAYGQILFLFLGSAARRRVELYLRFPAGRAAQRQREGCWMTASSDTGHPSGVWASYWGADRLWLWTAARAALTASERGSKARAAFNS